jgi:hypothetical protein
MYTSSHKVQVAAKRANKIKSQSGVGRKANQKAQKAL